MHADNKKKNTSKPPQKTKKTQNKKPNKLKPAEFPHEPLSIMSETHEPN